MTNKLKALAEWSRKFLADNTCYVLSSDMAESCLFHKWYIAPVLMQLGKREMEKRGYKYLMGHTYGTDSVSYMAKIFKRSTEYQEAYEEHENEYIAFWTAVRKALK